MTTPLGYFTVVLHSHIPYVVGHGRWPHGLDWLNEAAAGSYLRLWQVFRRLAAEGQTSGVTLGISPILAEMLASPRFKGEFTGYLENTIGAAQEDHRTFSRLGEEHLAHLAGRWEMHYRGLKRVFGEEFKEELLGEIRSLMDSGRLEVITSAATHGYLPLLGRDTAVQAQVKQGVAAYRRHFGRDPRGFWLPECAYRPRYRWAPPVPGPKAEVELRKGVEEFLSEQGLAYFFADSHLLRGGPAIGAYRDRFHGLEGLWQRFISHYQDKPEDLAKSAYQAYRVKPASGNSQPVAVFARDPKTGLQVWSGEMGYPGDGAYLDFHKKRFPGGLRYWRVTSPKADMAEKAPYQPQEAAARLQEQAAHFVDLVRGILAEYQAHHGKPGIVVAPYDTELFGHWWFEGPEWLYQVLHRFQRLPEVELVTAGRYLELTPVHEVIALPEGSWGEGGYHWIWLNEKNDWTWRHIYQAEKDMEELAAGHAADPDPRLNSLLKQCARSLLLLEASDWQFLITTAGAPDYAEMRVVSHFDDFRRLAALTRSYAAARRLPESDWNFLRFCQERDDIFPDLDPAWWARVEHPPEPG